MKPKWPFLTSAVVGGAAGALAMDLAQYVWATAFESSRPLDDQDEETEAITSVVRLLTRLAPDVVRAPNAAIAGRAIHYVFGVAFASAYFYLVPNRPPAVLRAAIFGTMLWLLSDRILIPALKLGRPWSRYSVAERSNALVSHLAYALIVEYARPRR